MAADAAVVRRGRRPPPRRIPPPPPPAHLTTAVASPRLDLAPCDRIQMWLRQSTPAFYGDASVMNGMNESMRAMKRLMRAGL